MAIEGLHPFGGCHGANDIVFPELHDAGVQSVHRYHGRYRDQSGFFPEIGLHRITTDDGLSVLSDTCKEGLQIADCAVLSFVKNEDAVLDRAAPDVFEPEDFNLLVLPVAIDLGRLSPILECVEHRHHPRCHLLIDVARLEPQTVTWNRHRWPGYHNSLDAASVKVLERMPSSNVGLTRPCCSESEYDGVLVEKVDELRLLRRARLQQTRAAFPILLFLPQLPLLGLRRTSRIRFRKEFLWFHDGVLHPVFG